MKTSSDIAIYDSVTILNTSHTHEVLATSTKALKVSIVNDGRWGGDGAKHIWIPRSLVTIVRYQAPRGSELFYHFDIELPKWFIEENKKKLV